MPQDNVPNAGLELTVSSRQRRIPANAMRIEYIAADFDEPDSRIERLFQDDTD